VSEHCALRHSFGRWEWLCTHGRHPAYPWRRDPAFGVSIRAHRSQLGRQVAARGARRAGCRATAGGALPVRPHHPVLPAQSLRRMRPFFPRTAILLPAWNEAAVIGTSIDRLMLLDYPMDSLRIYVIDDASTDATPVVVAEKAERYPGRCSTCGVSRAVRQGAHAQLRPRNRARRPLDGGAARDGRRRHLRADALARMSRHLADDSVGRSPPTSRRAAARATT